jgi:hypothetical protein
MDTIGCFSEKISRNISHQEWFCGEEAFAGM